MRIRSTSRAPSRGFTLLEVLIALAIVAMSVGALLGTVTSSASNVGYLKTKTIAEWVALNRLAELRISQSMPGEGARTGNSEMAGMRWQWEEEVTALPIKGMFRIEVRSRPTGETVDDRRPQSKSSAQKATESKSSGADLKKAAWSTAVTGVVCSARSDRLSPIAAPFSGDLQSGPNTPGGPNNPPGASPGDPNAPGGTPPPPKGQPRDR